jgi:IS30 family transposase
VWVARRVIGYEVCEEFFGLVCSGMSVKGAAALVGVSGAAALAWWEASGLMNPRIQMGARGGLPGSAAPRDPAVVEPAQRRRRPLTAEDRSAIAVGLRCRMSYGAIAAMIGRDRSVVSREVVRNRGRDGSYWGPVAHRAAHERRRRPKPFKLLENAALCREIEAHMDTGWSPKLIAVMLRQDRDLGRIDKMGCVSHETIYRALYVQTRGGLRQDLHRQLSLKRHERKHRDHVDGRGKSLYREAFTIRQRPAEVTDRAVPGHWEGDLILGVGNASAVGTLVERATRFVMLLHLPGRHDAASVAEAMIAQMSRLPEHLRRSLTWDRGSELADYARIQLELDMPVYFCDPRSPWQRGTNENTNRLLRFWLEKGTDLSQHTAADLDRIAATLNARPRPTLGLRTPAQALAALLADQAAA